MLQTQTEPVELIRDQVVDVLEIRIVHGTS